MKCGSAPLAPTPRGANGALQLDTDPFRKNLYYILKMVRNQLFHSFAPTSRHDRNKVVNKCLIV
jgi:hypothetical protein